MKPEPAARSRNAKRGTKMIEVAVFFWTNDLPANKHCRAKGKIKLVPNALHGIRGQREVHFQSLPDLLPKLERLFAEGQITVHPSQRERRYRAR
jgi:hypothetical protein